jgi:hypothetical protein
MPSRSSAESCARRPTTGVLDQGHCEGGRPCAEPEHCAGVRTGGIGSCRRDALLLRQFLQQNPQPWFGVLTMGGIRAGRRKNHASTHRTAIHHGTQRAPAGGVDRWRACAGCDHPSCLAQRCPLRGGPLRYATCPRAAGGDDVRFSHHRPTGGPVFPGAPEYCRPGATPHHDGPLGLGQLRYVGALRRTSST